MGVSSRQGTYALESVSEGASAELQPLSEILLPSSSVSLPAEVEASSVLDVP
jgi:hypothetical protein